MTGNNIPDDILDNDGAARTDSADKNSKTDSLAAAYAADKERKLLREEELQAARDYLSVLLEEAEGRAKELEGKKLEADALAERLSKTETEINELKTENAYRNHNHATFWMCFSIVELLLIAVLALSFYFKLSSDKPDTNEVTPTGVVSNAAPGTSNSDKQDQPFPADSLTAKYCDDLAQRIHYVSADSIAPFSVSVEQIDGLEYLVYSYGNIRVCYKNEYFTDNVNYRKCVMIENGSSRFTLFRNYDPAVDLVELCPKIVNLSNEKMLAFLDYNGGTKHIPTEIRLISCVDFRMYVCDDLANRITRLMAVNALEEVSPIEDAPIVYSLKTSKASYKFAISEAEATEIQYNEYEVPEIDSEFELELKENAISWATNVKLGNELYMGRLSGNLILTDFGLAVSGAKFSAYAPLNQEDAELGGYIRAKSVVPERFVTVLGLNGERFLIEVSDKVDPCEYYWDNLNTDDPNNWIYYDADGNAASIRGIDVSKYQGKIDWKKVADAGVEFAIIRLGYRGMNEGTLELDEYFVKNVEGATANKIKVGVYFFSQAVNEEEALEEADFVLNAIRKYNITYPVAFDTERVTTYSARANGLSVEDRTKICRTFCDAIAAEGYKPMIYANTKYMLMGLDLKQLNDIDKWFAIYSSDITFPYNFQVLQYSESGKIDGISSSVDLNISFVDYSKSTSER